MARKFLIIQTAFIGDVVLATSLVENIHAAFPDASIDFLIFIVEFHVVARGVGYKLRDR